MRRLLPDQSPTDVDAELAGYRPCDTPLDDRPHVAANMVTTLDGRAALAGRTNQLGGKSDTEYLLKLRTRFDAVMIGAGTMRAERYGRIVSDPDARAQREKTGLSPDPLAVIISGRLDLPFDAKLFTDGAGRVLIFTNDYRPAPETATPVQLVRFEGPIGVTGVLRHLRRDCDVRALLCEGGPHLLGQLAAAEVIDDLFLTIAPILTGEADAPRILEGELDRPTGLDLVSLAEDEGELLARYRQRQPGGTGGQQRR